MRGLLPERDLGEHVEPEEERELDLGREEWGKLEQAQMTGCLPVEDVASGGEGECACLCDRRRCSANVRLVELERGGQLDERRGCVPGGREIIAHVGLTATFPDSARTLEDTVESGADVVGAPLEEVRVQALEPLRRLRRNARGLQCPRMERSSGFEGGACLGRHRPWVPSRFPGKRLAPPTGLPVLGQTRLTPSLRSGSAR